MAAQEQFMRTARGGILYDASRVRKPSDALFEREHWRSQNALEEVKGGRGSIAVLRAPEGRWVLRSYRRGGWAAKASADRYVWAGEDRTRSFAEWRLLARLVELGLPAPAPIAARYERSLLTYRADLITAELPNARTLAQALAARALEPEEWGAVGATIAAFHRAGVHHADLNAHNVLFVANGAAPVYLLDFDRGRIEPRGAWEERVLNRLRRSLAKVAQPPTRFGEREWSALLEGYRAAPAR